MKNPAPRTVADFAAIYIAKGVEIGAAYQQGEIDYDNLVTEHYAAELHKEQALNRPAKRTPTKWYVYIVSKGSSVYVGKGCRSRQKQSLKRLHGDSVHRVFYTRNEQEAYHFEAWLARELRCCGVTLLN